MTDHEKNLVLAVVKHHMPPDLRAKVMREAPTAYNAWVGRDIVEARHVSDDRPVRLVA